jgi:hypothetical protein
MKRDVQTLRRPSSPMPASVPPSTDASSTPPTPAFQHHFADVCVDAPRESVTGGQPIQRCACKDKEEKKRVHREAVNDANVSLQEALPTVEATLSAHGEPLESDVRQRMEHGFGYDFSRVRVYDDARAAQSADALNAHAYTVGERVAFARGAYDPRTEDGRALLAHELAHVVQQGMGWTQTAPGIDAGSHDPLEVSADGMARRALQRSDVGAAGGFTATSPTSFSSGQSGSASSGATVQRQARFEPYRRPEAMPGHTSGNDYQGPNGIVTQQGENSANLGGSTWLGGLTSYGCYCGPGGDENGSRCGPNAPAIDEIDEQCRQHDQNYGSRGVSSVVRDPATQVSMFSGDGLLRTEDADRLLADSVDTAMRDNPGGFSPSARLYGQGIKGLFGARANLAHGYNWGAARYDEASTGWMGDRADEAWSGVGDFVNSMSDWDSAGDVVSGLGGGAGRALGWLGNTAGEAISGGSSALGSGLDWALNTGSEAASGVGTTAMNALQWGADTAGAVGDVVVDQASQLGSRAWDAIQNFDLSDAGIGQPLTSPALGGLLEEWF